MRLEQYRSTPTMSVDMTGEVVNHVAVGCSLPSLTVRLYSKTILLLPE